MNHTNKNMSYCTALAIYLAMIFGEQILTNSINNIQKS